MFARAFGVAIVATVLAALSLQAAGAGDKKKFEIPKDAIAGTVKSVDEKAAKFTITVKGKDKTFTVDAKTEFWVRKAATVERSRRGWRMNAWPKATKSKSWRRKTRLSARTCTWPNRKPKSRGATRSNSRRRGVRKAKMSDFA